MRSSAIARLAWEEIDFAQRGILTPAEKTKKKRRQWIEDLPDNLWKWLEQTPKEIFDLDERQIRHRRQMAFKRAGLLIEADDIAQENRKRDRKGLPLVSERPKCPPKNALRHSFVTYHVALHRNPGKTALIVSHKDQDCLYRHYLGIATKAAAADVAEFLHGLPFEPLTRRHYRTYLVSAYKWFIRQGWLNHNPASAVPAPNVRLPEPGILTVEETEALFRVNEKEDPGICALLALGAFAGMRSSAIVRLSREELDFKNRAILTPASKTKKGRRQFIEGLPDNLWPWLERAPAAAFKMTPRQYALRRQKAFERAGLLVTKAQAKKSGAKPKAPPKNCLRHSFVSYHVALHRDPGRTALLVSHKDQAILWEHYLGVARKEDAGRYFSTVPTV